MGPVEIALWDIVGKVRNLSVYEMTRGPCDNKIKAYASLMGCKKPGEVEDAAQRCLNEGYAAVKLHEVPGAVLDSIKAVHDAVGEKIAIMVDMNGAWNRKEVFETTKIIGTIQHFMDRGDYLSP